MAEHLPNKQNALSSKFSTAKKKEFQIKIKFIENIKNVTNKLLSYPKQCFANPLSGSLTVVAYTKLLN